MLAHFLRFILVIVAFTHFGESATPIPSASEFLESDSAEDAPNIAEFELTFGVDCNMPSLDQLEQMLRHHFELGVILYDDDVDEEIDVIVNIHETWKISRVVSYLQKDEGLSCDLSISEPIFLTSEILPDPNEFLAHLYESGLMHEFSHMEETDEERRNLLSSFPEVVDLRQFSTGVKDQSKFVPWGKKVGSCAAHSTAQVKEIHERMDYGLTEELSARFVYAHRKGTGASGMYAHTVFTVLRDEGIPLEKYFPITSYETSGKYDKPSTIPADVKRKAKMHRVSSVTSFRPSSFSEANVRDRLKQLINDKGAGLIQVSVFTTTSDHCKIYKKASGERYRGEHLMAVVGYNKEGLIIRNSWTSNWCDGGDVYISWHDAKKYAHEYIFWQDTPSRSCRNFEAVTGTTCWSLGGRVLNPDRLCQGKECSLVDAGRCCLSKPTTCLKKNSCCLWGTTCYGCPDNGNSQFEWAWNCGSSRRCNGRGNACAKKPGDCCIWGSDCHGCPWGNEHVFPNVCGSSRRCKFY